MGLESYGSYPSIFALGHKAIADIFQDSVIIEEKLDGSQCSWGRFDGELRVRSKGCQLNIEAPEKMFQRAVDVIQTLPLHDGWTYRGEYLAKPKHNTLAYNRAPKNNLIVFDINTGREEYMSYEDKAKEADRLGLEVVPLIYQGMVTDLQMFRSFLDRESVLGGQKIEGVVVKNYARFGKDKHVLMGKFVSEAFKETHQGAWREANPTRTDVIQQLIMEYRTPARWAKAVQHLKETGKLEGTPKDIGLIMGAVFPDIEKECKEEIQEKLYNAFKDQLRRGVAAGLPEWYKEQLLKEQFNE